MISLLDTLKSTLYQDERVLFAYLYGSAICEDHPKDIDIAVFSAPETDFHQLAADLKIDLHKASGLDPDAFDVRVINDLARHGDIFSLLYLKNILTAGRLLVDREMDARSEFLEQYGFKYRECEGLMQEVIR